MSKLISPVLFFLLTRGAQRGVLLVFIATHKNVCDNDLYVSWNRNESTHTETALWILYNPIKFGA